MESVLALALEIGPTHMLGRTNCAKPVLDLASIDRKFCASSSSQLMAASRQQLRVARRFLVLFPFYGQFSS